MSPSGKKMAIWILILINSILFSCDYDGAVLSLVFLLVLDPNSFKIGPERGIQSLIGQFQGKKKRSRQVAGSL